MSESRYEIMRQFSIGYAYGIRGTGRRHDKSKHWLAGEIAGFRDRHHRNAALDSYLEMLGMEKQAVIRLQGKATCDE